MIKYAKLITYLAQKNHGRKRGNATVVCYQLQIAIDNKGSGALGKRTDSSCTLGSNEIHFSSGYLYHTRLLCKMCEYYFANIFQKYSFIELLFFSLN